MDDNTRSFWELVEAHREPLWRFALGLTRSHEDAKDLVSETVLAAHKSFDNLRDVRAFRSVLYTVAIRLHKRRRWRTRIFGTIDEAVSIATDAPETSRHDLDLLLEALGRLPEKQREAILLFEMSGLSIREIREIQGGTESGVKARLVRARETLRSELADAPPSTGTLNRSFDPPKHSSLLANMSPRLDLN